MIAPFGADDVAGLLYAGERLRKLRFLMTDNIHGRFARARLGSNLLQPNEVKEESGKPLLLHVDDDDLLAYLVQREITTFEVRHVCDGEQAVRFLTEPSAFQVAAQPAVVLLDLHMPKKDGLATLREIRANPTFAKIPIVIFTTSQDPVERARAFAFGADHFLQKPSDLNGFAEIAEKLAHIVSGKNGRCLAAGATPTRLDVPEE